MRKLEVGMRVKVKAPMVFGAPRNRIWVICRIYDGTVELRRDGDDRPAGAWPPPAICCPHEVQVLRNQVKAH